MFVDIHSHIIPYADDGAEDEATAEKMLMIAADNGTTHIVATPHFIAEAGKNTAGLVRERCCELQTFADNEEIVIKIHSGCEVFISPEIPKLFVDGIICTINNSSYTLVELPQMGIPLYAEEVFYELQLQGLIPIIAHPERNDAILSNPGVLKDLVKRGILVQVNSGSITGIYGRKICKASMMFIKMGLAHFVASDAHTCGGRSPSLVKAAEIVKRKFGSNVAERLFYKNGMTVLENGIIE